MREILFRGKRVDNGEWIYGWLLGEQIHDEVSWNEYGQGQWWGIDIIPETVGQFTGLTDKTGKKIFEGDVVKVTEEVLSGLVVNEYIKKEKREYTARVIFSYGCFALNNPNCCKCCKEEASYIMSFDSLTSEILEIVGNATDSPELITK